MPESTATGHAQAAGEIIRDRRALARKVLIIGLDGATFDVLDPLMAAGKMPRLAEFIRKGASGPLRSTTPPITPAAWTTFLTGKQPGSHGIIDFERYDVHTNALAFNSTRTLDHVRNLWQILSDKGLTVGSINVPMTFPPIAVRGFMISGFETPSIETNFTYPLELKQDILAQFPDYSYKTKWRRSPTGGGDVFTENLDYITRSFHQGAALTRYCGEKFGWDVLMVVLKLVDNLQHKTWKYIDARTRSQDPQKAAQVEQCFVELDAAVGEMLDYAGQHGAHVLIVSDHGHGSLEGKAQPNLMLKRWGYLRLKGVGSRLATRARHQLHRYLKRTKGKFAAGSFSLEDDLAVDFGRTRAAVMHAGMAGFLYLNLKGRQPTGIVPPADYERLRDEIRERFLAERCRTPDGRTLQVFPEVHKPEEIYACSRSERPWLPDLLLTPADGLAAVRKIRGTAAVSWLPQNRWEGTHRPDGIFAAAGPGVCPGKRVSGHIVEMTPTILAMLGVNVPDDVEGRVLSEAFQSPLDIGSEAAAAPAARDSAGSVYSADEEDLLTQRLKDLGYLE